MLGRAGKRTGKYKNWYNVRDSEGNVSAVDLTNVSDLKVTSETDSSDVNDTNDEVLQLQHDEFDTAKQQELQSWKDHNVYESVPFEKQRCISVRWVCSLKTTESGIKPKARLVARGFEEQSDSIEKESPTCSKDAMRTMLSLINKNGWKLSSLDIKTAFLQGEKIDRDVYLRPPKEAKCDPGIVWKLHKCVYGLPDASLKWYEKVRKSMEGLNGKMSVLDNALFMWHKNGVLIGMIAVHVDDFLCAGNDIFLKKVKPCLGDTFSVGKEEATTFRYIGLHLDQTENSLSIHQKSYVSSLEPLEFTDVRFEERPLTLDEGNTLRSKVGQLLWSSNQTKPDICFENQLLLVISIMQQQKIMLSLIKLFEN